jgi:type II secretion system protein I
MTDTATSSSSSSRRPRAFTLLEVMVALAVVAFAFVGLLGLHGRNIQLADRAVHYSRATLLARELLTQLQFEDPADIGSGSGTFESYPEFHWDRTVDETTFETVRRVTIRVFWDGGTPIELVYYVGQGDE